jgi:hypothetical protein
MLNDWHVCDYKVVERSGLVRLQVLTVASMKMATFWDIAPCSCEVDGHFQRCVLPRYAPLKCRSSSTRLHGAVSQKAVIFRSGRIEGVVFILMELK